jgi:hypothetical protein
MLATVYLLPTVIGIARQAKGPGLVICLNTIPAGWPAALLLACLMPRKQIKPCSSPVVATRAVADTDAATSARWSQSGTPCTGGRRVKLFFGAAWTSRLLIGGSRSGEFRRSPCT